MKDDAKGWWLLAIIFAIISAYNWLSKNIIIVLNILGWYICVPFLMWLFYRPHWIYFVLWYITITLAILMYYFIECLHIVAEEEQRKENEMILKDMQDEEL